MGLGEHTEEVEGRLNREAQEVLVEVRLLLVAALLGPTSPVSEGRAGSQLPQQWRSLWQWVELDLVG